MLNPEKIRLMTQLSIYERKEGKRIIETSKYFKGDYVSHSILTASIYYTLCFIVITVILTIVNIEEILLQLNIPFIMESLHKILYVYLAGMVIMILLAYIRYSAGYDAAHRKSLFYTAKLDKLLRMQEDENSFLDITEDEAEYYRETGGRIRVYDDERNTWETVKPQFRTYVTQNPVPEKQSRPKPVSQDIQFTPVSKGQMQHKPVQSDSRPDRTVRRETPVLKSGDRIPNGGWLDEPIVPKFSADDWLDEPSTPKGGWLDEDMEDDDDGLDVLTIHRKEK